MFVITIDGLAGCGKSSIAKALAEKLNFKMLNTGAIYRGITCEYLKEYGEVVPTKDIVKKFISTLDVKVEFFGKEQHVFVCGTDWTPKLREEVVSNMTPSVSGFDILRDKVRFIQRDFASSYDCVVEGRDIGTVVLPNADCKFFFTASNEVRAQRRYEQMKESLDCPPFEEILKDIEKRDEIDRTREFGVMVPAKDAEIIDNSNETFDETFLRCLKIVQNKMKQA